MKVAAYVAGYGPTSGGAFTFESDLLEAFLAVHREARHEFCVLSPPGSGQALRERLGGTGIAQHDVTAHFVEQATIAALRQAPPAIRRRWQRPNPLDRAIDVAGADLVWFLGAGPHRTEKPYITVVWDVQHRVTPWFPEIVGDGTWDERERANPWFLQRASHIITGTEIGRAEIERYYQVNPERISLLPHPTPSFALAATDNTPIFPPSLRSRLGDPFVIYPAQLWPHKNHVNLLLALAELERKNAGIDLALVGSDKGNRAHIEQAADKLGLKSRVHFLGFVSREDLVALYKHALALVYPSWFGPENLPPLEAFALGCPVINSRFPGAEEQLGDAALFADPGQPAEFAARIEQLRADPSLRARLIEAGQARARQWTAQDYVRGVFGIVDRLEPVLRCWRPFRLPV